MMRWRWGLILGWMMLTACEPPPATPPTPTVVEEPLLLDWSALVPEGYEESVIASQEQLDNLDDEDPRAIELMRQLQASLDAAPVVEHLDRSVVRLPGFVVPLEGDSDKVRQFLLVPYYGACIHEPPPPANQIVLVEYPQGARIRQAFDTVWVTGRLTIRQSHTTLAAAGYHIAASTIEPYVDPLVAASEGQ